MRIPCALLLGALLVPTVATAADAALETQRGLFRDYRAARAAGQLARAARHAAALADYPLHPYVRYDALRARLHQLPVTEVAEFLAAHADSFIGERLRSEWLHELARRQRWDVYRRDYRVQDDLVLQCHALNAHLAGGADVMREARSLWLSGESRPAACDPAFARLMAHGQLTDELIWARIALAFAAGRAPLARYLAGRLRDPGLGRLANWWSTAHDDPQAVLGARGRQDGPRVRAIVLHALARRAAQDVERARQAWRDVGTRYAFDAGERGRAAAVLALAAARSEHAERIALLDAVPHSSVDAEIERYRLREGIAGAAWPQLVRWTAQPPRTADEALRWSYWRARALAATGASGEAEALWRTLARERDYYGFLAADRSAVEYSFNEVPVAAGTDEITAFLARPAIRRVSEFQALDLTFEARREWNFELARSTRREVEVAAAVATRWGWHERAIAALGQVRSYDDLELRFPLAHTALAQQYAARRKLDAALVLAIIRNESAFAPQARSPAGALGLMQLMPATAQETAARIGLRYSGSAMLFQPRENIALGSAYLAQLRARYHGNLVMAAAAYNAGPHRVRQWQGASCMEAERWIEAIPFSETRSYVRRALFYVAIYERRLGRTPTRLSSNMPAVPARGAAITADCSA